VGTPGESGHGGKKFGEVVVKKKRLYGRFDFSKRKLLILFNHYLGGKDSASPLHNALAKGVGETDIRTISPRAERKEETALLSPREGIL